MDFEIRQINDDVDEINNVKEFLFNQIEKEYHIGPTPKFHYDIFELDEYYIIPNRNNLFIAFDGQKIVATAGIRAYDKDFVFFNANE